MEIKREKRDKRWNKTFSGPNLDTALKEFVLGKWGNLNTNWLLDNIETIGFNFVSYDIGL